MSSPTKLKKRAEQVLPGSEVRGTKGRGREQGGEMRETMCAHTNV
jgi:hypothetical protein